MVGKGGANSGRAVRITHSGADGASRISWSTSSSVVASDQCRSSSRSSVGRSSAMARISPSTALEGQLLVALGRHRRRGVRLGDRQAEQRQQQRHRLRGVEPVAADVGLEPADPVRCRGVALQSERAAEQVGDRIERDVARLRRRAAGQEGVGVAGQLAAQLAGQAALADAGLAGEEAALAGRRAASAPTARTGAPSPGRVR